MEAKFSVDNKNLLGVKKFFIVDLVCVCACARAHALIFFTLTSTVFT